MRKNNKMICKLPVGTCPGCDECRSVSSDPPDRLSPPGETVNREVEAIKKALKPMVGSNDHPAALVALGRLSAWAEYGLTASRVPVGEKQP